MGFNNEREKMPLVSVIVPTYNVENYIDECMNSLLNQTYKNIEIVICDDHSTDKTVQALSKYKDSEHITVFTNDQNLRQASTRNKSINACKGDYIAIQDADDISSTDRIEKLIEAFEDGIDFVGSGCFYFNENEGKYKNYVPQKEYPQKRDLLEGIPFVHASIMFKRDSLLKVNGYRDSKHTTRGEDYDLILRLYAKGYRGKNIADLLYGYRVDEKTIARRTFSARVDECFVRYHGFKENKILFPFGWIYVFKPIIAHFYQKLVYRRYYK